MAISNHAVLVGFSPQGLFLLQQMTKVGYEVHAIGLRKGVGYYSRYGHKYLVSNSEELESVFRKIHKHYGPDLPCYVASGVMLDLILEKMPHVFDLFRVSPRPLPAVSTLSNKIKTYSLADKLGIPYPETFSLDQVDRMIDILSTRSRLIAKWNREYDSMPTEKGFKTRIIEDSDMLLNLIGGLSSLEKEHILFQELIDTSTRHNVSYLGYYENGNCLLGFLAQQIRQYPEGITSYLCEYTGPKSSIVIDSAQCIFKKLEYTGFGEAEFKFTKGYKIPILLEINPRTCGWSSALRTKYSNIHALLSDEHHRVEFIGINKRVTWANILRDIPAVFKQYFISKSLRSLISDTISWLGINSLDCFDWKDLVPFFAQPFLRFLNQRRTGHCKH